MTGSERSNSVVTVTDNQPHSLSNDIGGGKECSLVCVFIVMNEKRGGKEN